MPPFSGTRSRGGAGAGAGAGRGSQVDGRGGGDGRGAGSGSGRGTRGGHSGARGTGAGQYRHPSRQETGMYTPFSALFTSPIPIASFSSMSLHLLQTPIPLAAVLITLPNGVNQFFWTNLSLPLHQTSSSAQ
jgi:hypothetical protein